MKFHADFECYRRRAHVWWRRTHIFQRWSFESTKFPSQAALSLPLDDFDLELDLGLEDLPPLTNMGDESWTTEAHTLGLEGLQHPASTSAAHHRGYKPSRDVENRSDGDDLRDFEFQGNDLMDVEAPLGLPGDDMIDDG